MQLGVADQGRRLDGEGTDGAGFELPAEGRQDSPVPTPGQPDERLREHFGLARLDGADLSRQLDWRAFLARQPRT